MKREVGVVPDEDDVLVLPVVILVVVVVEVMDELQEDMMIYLTV